MTHPPQSTYEADPRDDIRPLLHRLPGSVPRRVLDVGCGRGGFAPTLRDALGSAAYLVGVEAVAESAAVARAAGFDEVHEGYFPDVLEGSGQTFDLIAYNDVLEHLLDPWAALDRTRAFLAPGGRILAAIPNIAWAPATVALLRGRWDYTDDGILDRTHVRFFTRATMVEMFERSGYRILACEGANGLFESRWRHDPVAPRRAVKRLLARTLGDRQYLHFIIVAEPVQQGESTSS